MKQPFITDERMQIITGRIAVVFLGLTQTALLGIILYRRYFLGQGEAHYADVRTVLLVSVFGYIAARLYYGAVLPVLSFKTLALIYVGFVATLTVILSIWYGPPTLDNWQNTILPVILGPAVLIGFYWLVSYLGKKRLEREIS